YEIVEGLQRDEPASEPGLELEEAVVGMARIGLLSHSTRAEVDQLGARTLRVTNGLPEERRRHPMHSAVVRADRRRLHEQAAAEGEREQSADRLAAATSRDQQQDAAVPAVARDERSIVREVANREVLEPS